jgi:hypothetical protein
MHANNKKANNNKGKPDEVEETKVNNAIAPKSQNPKSTATAPTN